MTRRDAMVGAVGAVVGAAAFVGVYEGKVAVSHAGQSVDVAAGQSAQADGRGVHVTGFSPSALASAAEAESAEPDPLLAANANLADTVREYRRRLDAIDADKKRLEKKLAQAEALLADGGAGQKAFEVSANKFDLTQEDWKDLAKQGKLPMRVPCWQPKDGHSYSPGDLDKLGLAPQDGPIIQSAMKQSEARTWGVIKPLCAKALPGANVDQLGQDGCTRILEAFADQSGTPGDEVVRQTAEIEAGLRRCPGRMTTCLRSSATSRPRERVEEPRGRPRVTARARRRQGDRLRRRGRLLVQRRLDRRAASGAAVASTHERHSGRHDAGYLCRSRWTGARSSR